jgi:hypothetical protein
LNTKNMIFFVLALGLFAGALYAIQNVTEIDEISTGSFEVVGDAESATISGSNVTTLNVTVNTTTMKWAGFKGNLSSILILSDGPQADGLFYEWDVSAVESTGNLVCASLVNNYDWTAAEAILIADLEANLTVWNGDYNDGADSVSNTFESQTCAIGLLSVSNTAGVDTQNPDATTCAISDGGAAAELAYCTLTNDLSAEDYAFGILVPALTDTEYFFYVELV